MRSVLVFTAVLLLGGCVYDPYTGYWRPGYYGYGYYYGYRYPYYPYAYPYAYQTPPYSYYRPQQSNPPVAATPLPPPQSQQPTVLEPR